MMVDLAICPSLVKQHVLFHQCHRFWMTVIIREDKEKERELHFAFSRQLGC